MSQWPEHDRLAWEAARQNDDLLDPDGRAASWTRKSVRCSLLAYGLWLDHLDRTDRLDLAATAGSRVGAEALATFITELQARVTPQTLVGYLSRLASMIAALDPMADRALLARAWQRLAARVPRPTMRLAPGLDSRLLLERALAHLHRLEQDKAPSAHILASWRRDALIVALLAVRPLRLANLTTLRVGQELNRDAKGFQLCIPAIETKSRREIIFDLPAILIEPLERYLRRDRPFLLGEHAGEERLWISVRRRPMSEQAIYCRVVATTAQLLGRPLHTHAFRHVAATSTAEIHPELLGIASRRLGHSSLSITRRHYDRSRMRLAQRRHVEAVTDLKNELRREFAGHD